MQKLLLIAGSVSGFLAVAIGAFGAHGLQSILEKFDRTATFQTGVQYHFYHTFALFIAAILMQYYPEKWLNYAGLSFLIGIVLFSGSLYVLSVTNISKLGAITPFGGLFFLIGWVMLVIAVIKK